MKRFLIAMAMAAAVIFAPAIVKADTLVYGDWVGHEGGFYVHYFSDKGDWKATFYYDKDSKLVTSKHASNPNPENDNQGGAIEPPDVATLKKLADAANRPFEELPQVWETPLGKALIAAGKGPVPAINPAPGDDVGGHKGPKKEDAVKPGDGLPWSPFNEKVEEKEFGGIGKTFEFQPNAGSPGEQIHGMAGKKGSTGDPSNPDKKDAVTTGAYFGDLPGPPELVNPAWGGKATKLSGPDDAGKSSKAIIPIGGGKTSGPGDEKGLLPAVQKSKTGKATAKLGTSPDDQKAKGLLPAVKTKTALKCGPSTTPNAKGTACLPKLDMQGLDASLGSSGGGVQGAAGGAVTRRR